MSERDNDEKNYLEYQESPKTPPVEIALNQEQPKKTPPARARKKKKK